MFEAASLAPADWVRIAAVWREVSAFPSIWTQDLIGPLMTALTRVVGGSSGIVVLATRESAVGAGGPTKAHWLPAQEYTWRREPVRRARHGARETPRGHLPDRLAGKVAVGPEGCVFFELDRQVDEPRFSDRDRAAFQVVLDGLVPLCRAMLRSHGLLAGQTPLAPRERELLQLLLEGMSEKEAAHNLGLTTRSAHQYVVSVYRKLKVRSRPELMALWLR